MEKSIHVETIYQGKVISLQLHEVLLASNRLSKREIVKHRGAVTIIPHLGETILFVRQYRSAVEKSLLELPAGTREVGEALEETAHRELLEETGYAAGKLIRYPSFYSSPGYSSEEIHLFLAQDLQKIQEPTGDVDEELEVVPLKQETVYEMLLEGAFHDGKTLAGLSLFLLQEMDGR